MPPRISARLKAKVENRLSSGITTPQTVLLTEASTSRPQKKQKGNAAPVRPANYAKDKGRKKRKLTFMTEMPLDILFEIFARLEPVDLLHLSRASKDLRNILITSNTTFLWELAYQNLTSPPPACPAGMNLRHYTNFLYGRYCQFCASPGRQWGFSHWAARVRICRGCIPKHTMDAPAYPNTSTYSLWFGTWCRNKVTIEDEALNLCVQARYEFYNPANCSCDKVLKIEYDQILRALQANEGDPLAFRSKQQSLQQTRQDDGHRIRSWCSRQEAEHVERQTKRRNEIVQRIQAEGLGTGLDIYQMLGMKLLDAKINLTKELSDQDWERIKPRLIRLLEDKKYRVRENMIDQFKLRINKLSQAVYSETPKPLVVPPIVHFARAPLFASRVKCATYAPIANWGIQDLSTGPLISVITISWRESVDHRLRGLLPLGRSGCLELATTFFKCHWCEEPISYPRILMHGCLRDKALVKEEDEDDTDKDEGKHVCVSVESVWNDLPFWYGTEWNEGNDQVSFDHEASGFARVIVKACGKNPDKATFEEMNNLDPRVECLSCSNEGRNTKRLVMNWTTALLHDIDKHFEVPAEKGWLSIGKKDTAKAKELESKLSSKWSRETSRAFTQTPLPLDTPMKRPPYAVKI